ncbi:MAG: citrate/2-methylcitrate synthase, partial [Alphaproteobacteria bacterium]|nr:citrate/2-methylcitrate synthase [Alphaproteobacteria bacterium]
EEGRDNITTNLVAKTPAIVAAAIRASRQKTPEDLKNLTFIDPDPSKGYVENFLRMCFAKDNETEYTSDPVAIESLNCLFICHGDHEQNASTNTIRLVASTDAPWCATFPAGIGSLWGRLHGGAAQASAEMLERIGTPENVEAFIEDVKTNGAKVMGFGHRIYKNGDPRADIIEEKCKMLLTLPGEEVWDNLSEDDKKKYHLLQTADKLENAISNDEYFRKLRPGKSPEDEDAYQLLRPNVDFRSGILYHMMGFHPQEYTALFALARMAGWAAQWNEDFDKGKRDLGRPRQRYVGKECRDFVARKDRPPSKPQKPVVAPDSAEAAPKI